MGAFQSHETYNDVHGDDTPDRLDLTLDVTVAKGALPPRYETPSASQFVIFANETVTVEGGGWVPVRTGLCFAMPFMLVLIVRGAGFDWEVQEQVVDYDATDELVVRVRQPAHQAAGAGAGELTRIVHEMNALDELKQMNTTGQRRDPLRPGGAPLASSLESDARKLDLQPAKVAATLCTSLGLAASAVVVDVGAGTGDRVSEHADDRRTY